MFRIVPHPLAGAWKVYAGMRREMAWDDDRVVPLVLDVTDAESIRAAVSATGDISLLVNNAGILGPGSLLTSSLEEIRATFETNVFGPLVLVRALAPTLARADRSAVVDVHSTMSWLADPGAYSPSKAAFWGLTNSLRLELSGQGTQVLGAHLGPTDTPMIAAFDCAKAEPGDVIANILDALEAGPTTCTPTTPHAGSAKACPRWRPVWSEPSLIERPQLRPHSTGP